MGTALLLVYLAGCMIFFVPTARWFLRNDAAGIHKLESSDYVEAVGMTFGTVWFWPLYLPGWWAIQLLKADERSPR